MSVRVIMIGPGSELMGGITTVVETLVPTLEKRVDLRYFATVKSRPPKESGKISLRNIILAFAQYARFLAAMYCFRPQVIHLHTSQGAAWLKDTLYVIVSKILRSRFILHVHAAEFDELFAKKSSPVQYYTRKVMGFADVVIAVSEEWKKWLSQIVPPDRVLVFRNCISVDAITRHVSPNGAKALFLGSVGPRKGAFDLLEAVGRLKSTGCPLQVWVAGFEERKGDFTRASGRSDELQLGDAFQLLGNVRGREKVDLLKNASFFVLPSYNEGLPMAILEAMAAGLAVVATPVGGIPEVVRDGDNGFLVRPGDVETLAEKLALLANDRTLREFMGQRSREIAEQELDVKPYAERLIGLYEAIARR
jgi:glycosyltransferase involved in cell wall biosynthesis